MPGLNLDRITNLEARKKSIQEWLEANSRWPQLFKLTFYPGTNLLGQYYVCVGHTAEELEVKTSRYVLGKVPLTGIKEIESVDLQYVAEFLNQGTVPKP